jgi:hypothetical protein
MSIKVFELLAMINSLFIAPSRMDRGSELETWSGVEQLRRGDAAPNLLTLAGIFALQSGRGSFSMRILI